MTSMAGMVDNTTGMYSHIPSTSELLNLIEKECESQTRRRGGKKYSYTQFMRDSGIPEHRAKDWFSKASKPVKYINHVDAIKILRSTVYKPVKVSFSIEENGELFPISGDKQKIVTFPAELPPDTQAAIVNTDDIFPFLRRNWVIFFSEEIKKKAIPIIEGKPRINYNKPDARDVYAEYFDKPAVIELSDGHIFLGEIKRGSESGRYDLRSHNRPDRKDVEIRRAHKIIMIDTDLANDLKRV